MEEERKKGKGKKKNRLPTRLRPQIVLTVSLRLQSVFRTEHSELDLEGKVGSGVGEKVG